MSWHDDFIARHRAEIEQMRRGIELMEADKFDIYEVDGGGKRVSLREEMIADYRRITTELEGVIERLEKMKAEGSPAG